MGTGEVESSLPHVSIIVPAYNEALYIGACLQGVQNLDYPPSRIQTIVVDNGSSDGTADIARQSGVTVVELSSGFVGAVRNFGADAAEGDILAFIDGDCVPDPSWLRVAVSILLEDNAIGAVGGCCLAPADSTWVERAWEAPRKEGGVVPALAASSLVMRRRLFEELGGFNESLSAGEDDEFSHRIQVSGKRLVYSPVCTVYHLGWPKSLAEVFNRQRWQGSTQLDTARHWWDPNLIATHALSVAPAITLFLLFLIGPGAWATWTPVVGALGLPLAAATRRVARHSGPRRLTRLAQLVPVYCAYYLGRCTGLWVNYMNRIGLSPKRVDKTWQRTATRPADT